MNILRYIFIYIFGSIFQRSFGQGQNHTKEALRYFKEGEFDVSESLFMDRYKIDPKNFKALFYLGYLHLLSNHLADAELYLLKANKIKPNNKSVLWGLSELYYRKNDYQRAASYFGKLRRFGVVKKLESFGDSTPYRFKMRKEKINVPFLVTDPLPVIEVEIRGKSYNFFIDTGGGEVILNKNLMETLGLPVFGFEKGPFAGGKLGTIYHCRLESIKISDLEIQDLPIMGLDLLNIDKYFPGTKIDGIIGTNLLFQFISTIDYINGQLVLRQKGRLNETSAFASMKFWLAPDHFILAKGSINNSRELLFFVDTGLIGSSFITSKTTLKEAGIILDKRNKMVGEGGGGKVKSLVFPIETLRLGNVEVLNTTGYYQKFPWENMFGFRIGGLISHEFFMSYAVTFDFDKMILIIDQP